ncbi:response regulator [Emcibacter nanhaiensis]|uniref:Response regulator n=1 Tax=Emcibacter nanhaiensis TaxID=1505037 RepID=A0A501PJ38_9PROT|nr:response regulator [Emcibacter nanhaiensis]TPD60022.1 response regulator [Emcibacter nanhaiensis]
MRSQYRDKSNGTWENPEILIVDDDEEFLSELHEYIESFGYICHTSTTGVDALKVISTNLNIGIVITDVRLPIMDGVELLDRLHSGALRERGIQAILVTGHPNLDDLVHGLDKNVVNYLVKPINPDALKESISLSEYNYNEHLQHTMFDPDDDNMTDSFVNKLTIYNNVVGQIRGKERPDEQVVDFESLNFPVLVSPLSYQLRPVQSGSAVLDYSGIIHSTPEQLFRSFSILVLANQNFLSNSLSQEALLIVREMLQCENSRKLSFMTSLCTATQLPQATLERKINELEELKIVEKRHDTRSRRRSFVVFTETGRRRLRKFLASMRLCGEFNPDPFEAGNAGD